jgi:hypothetical protein
MDSLFNALWQRLFAAFRYLKPRKTNFSKVYSSGTLVEPGSFDPGEKPGDFAGIWQGPQRDLDQLRKAAWDRPWHDQAEEENEN